MTKFKQNTPGLDDLLADFTDRVLDEKNTDIASFADEELRDLEETILHLHRTLPHEAPDRATINRLQTDFKSRVQKAERPSRPAWRSRQYRQRWALAFISIAIVAIIFIVTPLSLSGGGNLQGTAGLQPKSIIFVLIAGGGIISLIIWLGRRQ